VIHLFCGYDSREAIGWHVFVSSVLRRASRPVAIHRLDACGLPQGTNEFTRSRFLVPWLMEFKGHAIFADAADMLCLGDVAELDAMFDDRMAVQVVQHATYKTRNPRKYVGTKMESDNRDYPLKNWASLMLMNCAHPAWRGHGLAAVEMAPVLSLLQLSTANNWPEAIIGALPSRWNRLVDEGHPVDGAALLHWTAGIPAFPHYADAPGADAWRAEHRLMMEHA
jgi:hypothetical protein